MLVRTLGEPVISATHVLGDVAKLFFLSGHLRP